MINFDERFCKRQVILKQIQYVHVCLQMKDFSTFESQYKKGESNLVSNLDCRYYRRLCHWNEVKQRTKYCEHNPFFPKLGDIYSRNVIPGPFIFKARRQTIKTFNYVFTLHQYGHSHDLAGQRLAPEGTLNYLYIWHEALRCAQLLLLLIH